MATKTDQAEALNGLREIIREGDVITCVWRGRTANGTTYADFYVLSRQHERQETCGACQHAVAQRLYLTRRLCTALGFRWNKARECASLPFMNMDQAFAVVSTLSRRLFGRDDALTREWL